MPESSHVLREIQRLNAGGRVLRREDVANVEQVHRHAAERIARLPVLD